MVRLLAIAERPQPFESRLALSLPTNLLRSARDFIRLPRGLPKRVFGTQSRKPGRHRQNKLRARDICITTAPHWRATMLAVSKRTRHATANPGSCHPAIRELKIDWLHGRVRAFGYIAARLCFHREIELYTLWLPVASSTSPIRDRMEGKDEHDNSYRGFRIRKFPSSRA